MDHLVSVVIPAYNREATIASAVHSVLRQSWPNLEVIVVDDGSKDATVAAVRAISDPRVRLIESPANAGISAARNRGIMAASADWIAFQDSDDEWLPEKLARQFATLSAHHGPEPQALYCGFLIVEEGARTTTRYFPPPNLTHLSGDILETLLLTNPVSTQTLVARKSALHAVGLFDESLKSLVDWDLAIRLAQQGSFLFTDEPLVMQRFSPNSVTKDEARRIASWEQLLEKHAPIFARQPEALLTHYSRLSGGHRNLGNREKALHFSKLATRLDPLNARLRARALALRLGR